MKRTKHVLLALTVGGVTLSAGVLAPLASRSASAGTAAPAVHAASLTIVQTWKQQIADGANAVGDIGRSSPIVATLADGQPSVVVGDRAGRVYAFHVADGTPAAGWAGGVYVGSAVDSTPSVSGTGAGAIIYVGSGNTNAPSAGGYSALNANGSIRWYHAGAATPTGGTSAVSASLSVGDLQGGTDVVAGDLGQEQYAFDGPSGNVLNGFPWFQADSQFSTAALAPLGGGPTDSIIEGGASTAGNAYQTQYSSGGHLRILSPTGNAGQPEANGGLACQYNPNEEVDSSPAVGGFGPGGATEIAFGTGSYYAGASSENQLLAVDTSCNLAWATTLDGQTASSPALVDALGNGGLQVAEGTDNGNTGSVYLINGANGSVIWRTPESGFVLGSVTSADLTGSGYQDIIAPTSDGIQILDGRTGAAVDTLSAGLLFQSSPLVTDDANGTIGITVAGYNIQAGESEIDHYEVSGSNGSHVGETGAWPMFHHDPQLTGDAAYTGNVVPASTAGCAAPGGGPRGYLETASDGGVFNFGNLPFCGSTGSMVLNRPVVGSAETPDAGGYWLVASDGGIFAFGDASFYGSTGATALRAPIVGMASTPDGRGYWLVASDGGIFAFGDASYYGSMGGSPLSAPIVGMAPTPGGGGYWLVASDGGIFAFGNAGFYGSTGHTALNRPVVGMASSGDGRGYWLAASDGGIFTFGDARYLGSTGGIVLNQPVVGVEATTSSGGYRLVASDGGVFDFGNATFDGSEGNHGLNRPIVSIGGF